MEKIIYTAMSGAQHALMSQQIHANNLANVDTKGFRADFDRVTAQALQGDGFGSRIMATELSPGTNFTSAALVGTGRNLDVGIRGAGWLTVQTSSGEAYTRDGEISVAANGTLTIQGKPVVSDSGPLVLPEYRDLQIGSDGTITITPPGGGAQQQLGRLKLVNPSNDQLTKGTDGLFRLSSGNPADRDETVVVASGYLENSNTNAVDEMVQSLQLTRSFELQVKLMENADTASKEGNQLISGTSS